MIEAIGILVLLQLFLVLALHYRDYRIEQRLDAIEQTMPRKRKQKVKDPAARAKEYAV